MDENMTPLMTHTMQPFSHPTPPAIPPEIRAILTTVAVLMPTELMRHLTIGVVTLDALIIMTDFNEILAPRTTAFFFFAGT
jgi:hypothetical protein